MSYTERLSEGMEPLAVEPADVHAPGTVTSPVVSMQNYHRAWLVVNVGEMGQLATLDAQIVQYNTAAGGGVAAILAKNQVTNKAITQLSQAAGDGDDLVCIELQTEELNVTAAFQWIGFIIVTAIGNVEYSAVLYGCISRHKATPAANWTEIID